MDRRRLLTLLIGLAALSRPDLLMAQSRGAIRQTQERTAKGVTVGTLTGTGLGEPVYARATAAAPRAVRTEFTRFVQTRGTALSSQAVDSYYRYRDRAAGARGQSLGDQLIGDIRLDVASFGSLSGAMDAASASIGARNNLSLSQMRQLRARISELRREVVVVDLESNRATFSDTLYQGSRRAATNSRAANKGELETGIGRVQQEARRLVASAREVRERLFDL